MYESIELTTSRGDKIYVYTGAQPVIFEYDDDAKQYVFCDDGSYAYTHGGVRYQAACDAIAELATA